MRYQHSVSKRYDSNFAMADNDFYGSSEVLLLLFLFPFAMHHKTQVSTPRAKEQIHSCAIRILGLDNVHNKDLIQEMEAVLVVVVEQIRNIAKQAIKVEIVAKAKSLKMTFQGKVVRNYSEIRQVWLQEVPWNEELLEDFYNIFFLQFDSNDGSGSGKMDKVICHVMESLEIWTIESNDEPEMYSRKPRSYKPSIRTVCFNVLRDSFRNCLVGKKSKRSERSHGITLTKHAKKGKMDWLTNTKNKNYKISTFYKFGFQKEINVKGWDGQDHREWKEARGPGKGSKLVVCLQYKWELLLAFGNSNI